MKTIISKIFRQKEHGFLLSEVLIALIIASTIAIGASAMVIQLMSVNSTNANTATVTSNIDSATHYLTRDIQMSEINAKADPITGIGETETEWLWLEWTWTDGRHHVAYEIEGSNLYHTHTIDGSLEGRTLVAKYIDASQSTWELVIKDANTETGEPAKLSVEVTISASTGGYKPASETRTIQVVPRITP